MSLRRYSAEEKAKGTASATDTANLKPCKRIQAPEIDTSRLINENALTLIGRVLNPKKQPIGALISGLPRKWTLRGGATGSDLG
ncbi:hypothetical protein Bca4012_024230 [Brassica carinata]|uniref:Uncharacterized protein n=1 Tax=Brassica carinata TaxID=52824 RepID=A0A8X7P733_BRACI|nr:hypothetical protein Bca52824_092923 [Brassica carinata]